ncbi:hypothetical protein SAMN05880582_106147 [Rhizobium sp. RU20A]|uniref:nucleotidyltransferase family protein n=1 Tax=Rhizobium sp. RU20A TaxID=1907412 RepID=UPI000954F0CE|nr:nucleotidyltransferase domain-containing protein [Rhizobium sp. RU20A]SIR09405.1 hypothetical protein SAMN05880582_106147 [Rhizobium sp. RU20A]
MNRERIIAELKEHRSELEAAGAQHLSVFGSVARRENGPDSDLDILVTLAPPVLASGFGYYSALEILTEKIAHITGAKKVDVVAEPLRKAHVRANIEKDRIVAF